MVWGDFPNPQLRQEGNRTVDGGNIDRIYLNMLSSTVLGLYFPRYLYRGVYLRA